MEERNLSRATVVLLPKVEQWRPAPPAHLILASDRSVFVRRYSDLRCETREKVSSAVDQFYTVGLGLRATEYSAHLKGTVFRRRPHPGALYITEPSCIIRAVFYKPIDSIMLLVPVSLLLELGEECDGYRCPSDHLLRTVIAGDDRTLHTLIEALGQEDTIRCLGGQLYADSLGIAILFYLLNRFSTRPLALPDLSVRSRASKSIQRAQEYIDAHLTHPVSLADLARVAGLSRMYFAAQFRQVTGLRPHEYLLRQRIERGKQLMLASDLSVAAIAPMVGFETDSHFCTVFKRFVGQTPARWRRLR